MKKIEKIGLCACLLLMTNFAQSQGNNGMSACISLHEIVTSVIERKAKGIPKQVMISRLAPKRVLEQSEFTSPKEIIALNMHEIIDDVYDFETPDRDVYAHYAVEKCLVRVDGGIVKPYQLLFSNLKKCGTLHTGIVQRQCVSAALRH